MGPSFAPAQWPPNALLLPSSPMVFNGDWWVLEGNAKAHGQPLPFAQPFRRLKPLLADLNIGVANFERHGYNEVCSGGLATVLGIEMPTTDVPMRAHDAAHDARSLAHSIHKLFYSQK